MAPLKRKRNETFNEYQLGSFKMITLGPVRDEAKVKGLFAERNIEYSEVCDCVAALNGDEVLGLCLYSLDKEKITVLRVF